MLQNKFNSKMCL